MLNDWTPDIVVLDAMMPGLDGFATCQALRALAGFEHMPVLMLTGLDDEASINRAYQVGATDFLVKSTQWSLLAGRLRNLLRSPKFIMYYLTFLLPGAQRLLEGTGFDVDVRPGGFDWPLGGLRLVTATKRVPR